ncbi:hypothetical protein GW17_00010397 [Ensete ventricosum]|nr:hypothetical protein GW17_00010397 [Ensete ventricosum]RZS08711.1 hypothetical protein BHM03_00039715 [Ensete ventricosum]
MSIAMSYLSMMEARLPPGFRFHPRDEELVCDYLMKKVAGDDGGGSGGLYGCHMMIHVDLNKCEPWHLPGITPQPPTTLPVARGTTYGLSALQKLRVLFLGGSSSSSSSSMRSLFSFPALVFDSVRK